MPSKKSLLSRIKDIFTFSDDPVIKISPERVEEIIETIVVVVSNYGLELPALLLTKPFVPTSTIIGQTIVAPFAPFLETFGVKGYELAAFLDDKENLKRLISRIEEINK